MATDTQVPAGSSRPISEDERYVLEKINAGRPAAPRAGKLALRGVFVASLLTNRDAAFKTRVRSVIIFNAVITGDFSVADQDVLYDVFLYRCEFEGFVSLRGSRFSKSLDLLSSDFRGGADLSDVTVADQFRAERSSFWREALFDRMRVGRDFRMDGSQFVSWRTSFAGASVQGAFSVDECTFKSWLVSFNSIRIVGSFSARRCEFRQTSQAPIPENRGVSQVDFEGAHLGDMFLNGSSFHQFPTINFTRLEADFISFDEIEFKTPTKIGVQRMTFNLLSPRNVEQLQFLLNTFNAAFYTDLENSFRTHGYPHEADKIFVAKKRAERRENCKSFFRECNRVAWASSVFQDALAGYGKRLQNLLYWSLGFLVIGMLVFRSEKGMRPKDWNTARDYVGRYHPFWYSLDLFLPIIKLGEADVWTPKDNRRWANLYKKVHIIIGSLFVPIGLAAWTGIIK